MTCPVESAIIELVQAQMPPTAPAGGVEAFSSSLIDSGILDSIAILDLIAAIEERFNLRFVDEDLTRENFNSIAVLARLVDGKLA